MKTFKYLLCCAIFARSTAGASGVMMEMFSMNRDMIQLTKANSVADFNQAAEQFLVAAVKAQQTMPNSLQGDENAFKGYQAGMQEVIDVVKNAQQLAEKGDLESAKTVISRLPDLKNQYHQQYK